MIYTKYYKIDNGKLITISSKKDETINGYKIYTEDNEEVINALKKTETAKNLKNLTKAFNSILDSKLKDFRHLLTETIQFDILAYEYARKEDIALKAKESGDYSVFDEIAVEYNMTSEEFANSVLEKSKYMRNKEDKFLLKLGSYRSKFNNFYQEENIEALRNILNDVENINLEDYL